MPLPSTTFQRRARRGMTMTEVLVVVVIGLILVAVLAPSLTSFLALDQHKAAKNLALLYEQLHDEAVMRNVTFRVEYDMASGKYQVQVAEAGALIFDNPRAREEWEDEQRSLTQRMTKEELAEHERKRSRFGKVEARFDTEFELPDGIVIGGIYTPQYGEMMLREDLDEDEPRKFYSYIFPNGKSEHTVVWLTDSDNPDDGYTIEVEPLSGGVTLHGELKDHDDSFDFVPDEAPDLPGI